MTREARDLKRNVRVDTDIAVLGDAQGNTTQHLPLGLIRVRRRTGAGLGTVEIIRAFGGSAYPLLPGCEVHIGRDLGGRLAVLGATYEWMVANGFDPNYLNSGNPRYDWVDLRNAIPLRSAATQPPSLKVSIWPLRWIDHDKVVHEFPGANLDISTDIPAAGNHGLIVTYIKSDDTADYTASTPKALPESVNPIVLADIQECVTAAPDDAIWSGIWHVKNDQGQVTANDLYDDLRQWINVPGVGSGVLDDAVILAPDSVNRNTIAPTADGIHALRLVPFQTSQSVPTFLAETGDGSTAASIRNRTLFAAQLQVGTITLTVTGGAVSAFSSRVQLRAQSGTTDDLDTISVTTPVGTQIIFIQPDVGDVITVKHATGNIRTIDGNDVVMSDSQHMLLIYHDASNFWHQVNFFPGQDIPAGSIASGVVAHEHGGLEADVSAYDGLVGITGGATFAEALPLGTDVGGTGADNSANNEGDAVLSNGANGVYVTSPLPTTVRNRVLDPRFDHWPEGTSGSPQETADYASVWARLVRLDDGGTSTCAWSRQAFTVGQADVPHNPTYFLRMTGSISGGGGNERYFNDFVVEDVRSYAGETITFSIWLDGSAAQTIAAVPFQNFGVGGSASVYGTGQELAVTTDWQRLHLTFVVPSISGKTIGAGSFFAIRLFKQAGSTIASSANLPNPIAATGTADLWGPQIDRGGIMTAFDDRPVALEQHLIARYFQEITSIDSNTAVFGVGVQDSGGDIAYGHIFNTPMRAAPSLLWNNIVVRDGSTAKAVSAISLTNPSVYHAQLAITPSSAYTTGAAIVIRVNSTTGYLRFDARF